MYGGQTQYMPLKVNYAGVMPIIFAWALLAFPDHDRRRGVSRTAELRQQISDMLSTGWLHYVVLAAMIFFFSYFWVATQFQPAQIADDLKKYGGYIPGVRPGKPTADFLDFTMTRLTFAGAIFLTMIAVLPQSAQSVVERSADHRAIFRRHQLADYRGRHARHDAAGGDASDPAALRWIPAQGAHPRPRFRSRQLTAAARRPAGHVDVALCRHRRTRHRRGGDFPLRSLGEKATRASGCAGFRKRNSGGNDHAAIRYSGHFARRDSAAREGLGTPLGIETAEMTQHGGLVPDKIIVQLIEDWLRLHGATVLFSTGFRARCRRPKACGEILDRHHTRSIWRSGWSFGGNRRDRIASRLQCRAAVSPPA